MAATAPTSTDCVMYLKCEETSGLVAYDATSLENDATISGVGFESTGIVDDCFDLDGVNDFIRTAATTDILAESGSISLWVNPDAVAIGDRVFDQRTTSYLTARFTSTGGLLLRVYDDEGYHDINATLSTGSWQHLVLTWNTSEIRVYVNGSSVDSDTGFSGLNTDAQDTGVNFGCPRDSLSTSTYFYDGLMDEICIFKVALTADNVTYLYNSGSPGSDQQYPFSGSTATDKHALYAGCNF